MIVCTIAACENTVIARTWCTKHYKRWYKTGNPLLVKSAPNGNRKKHPLYSTYCDMLNRCNNPNNKGYKHYGGRGIAVDARWTGIEGFDNFLEDMGERPTPKHSIERRDNNGNYTPSNCHWATKYEQAQNKRQYRNNSSGHNGVLERPNGRWAAFITRNGIRKFKTYDTKQEAVQGRLALEMELAV